MINLTNETPLPPIWRTLPLHAGVFGLYLLVAIIVTWPLLPQLSTVLAGFVYGDAHEMAHHIWWFTFALRAGEPLFTQTLLGYPDGIPGVTLWANPLQFFPAWAFAFMLPLPAAANLTLLLTLALNGWAMWLLARTLRVPQRGGAEDLPVTDLPALIAGLVFMLYPTMQGHLGAGHAGLLVQWPLPLFALFALRLREQGGPRPIVLTAFFFFLSATGHTLQAIYALFPLTLVLALSFVFHRQWAAVRRLIAAAALGAGGLTLFLLPVAVDTLGTSAYLDEGGAVRYSADLLAFASPSFFHPLFGALEFPRRVLGINLDEGLAYVGILAGLLALLAIRRGGGARRWLALGLLAYLLSLGPLLKVFDTPVRFTIDGFTTHIVLPWALAADAPLLSLARTPGRFNFALALAVAALTAGGAAIVLERVRQPRARALIALALGGLIAFEYQVFWPLPTIPAAIPEPVRALALEPPDPAAPAVFDIPWDDLVAAKYGLYLQTGHERPLIAGQVSRRTPVNPALLALLEETLDPALLRSVGVGHVIVHRERDDGMLEARAQVNLGGPVFSNERLALFAVPPAAQQPQMQQRSAPLGPLERRHDSFIYSPEAGWALLEASLRTDEPLRVAVLHDGEDVHRLVVDGEAALRVPLPIDGGEFHAVALALEPPCPPQIAPGLRCRSVDLQALSLSPVLADDRVPAPTFEGGIALAAARTVPLDDRSALDVWLAWSFAAPPGSDLVRFIHLLDEDGRLVAQDDRPLPLAESRWHEAVSVALSGDLPAGTYTVMTGWYRFSDLARLRLPDGTDALRIAAIPLGAGR
ncbi:MAG: hypothetical protein SNJ59_11835 [Aggregatilineales bacterium]